MCHQSSGSSSQAFVLPERDPGVVDEDVEGPELLLGPSDHPLDVGAVGDVGLDRDPADLGCGRLHLLPRARGDGDARPGAGQLERDPAPDPAPAARDERDPARELRSRRTSSRDPTLTA